MKETQKLGNTRLIAKEKIDNSLHLTSHSFAHLQVLNDLVHTHLRLSVHPVHKHDRHLPDRVVQLVRTHNHLHLEHVSLALHQLHYALEHLALEQTEAARQVAHARVQQRVRYEVRHARGQLPLEVPTIHTSSTNVTTASHHVVVALLLLLYHHRHVFRLFVIQHSRTHVMRQVRIHQKHKRATNQFQTIHVCTTQTQFTGTLQHTNLLLTKHSLQTIIALRTNTYLQLHCYIVRTIRRVVVNYDHFITIPSIPSTIPFIALPIRHCLVYHVHTQRQIFLLVVSNPLTLPIDAHVGNNTEYCGCEFI